MTRACRPIPAACKYPSQEQMSPLKRWPFVLKKDDILQIRVVSILGPELNTGMLSLADVFTRGSVLRSHASPKPTPVLFRSGMPRHCRE